MTWNRKMLLLWWISICTMISVPARWRHLYGHHAVVWKKNTTCITSCCATNKSHTLKWKLTSSKVCQIISSSLTIQSLFQCLAASCNILLVLYPVCQYVVLLFKQGYVIYIREISHHDIFQQLLSPFKLNTPTQLLSIVSGNISIF